MESSPLRTPDLPTAPPAPPRVVVAGHTLTVFVESPPLIDAMVQDILAARHRVWLEVYIFYHDASGQRIAAALKQKAREGLDVRVLYDAIGSVTTATRFFAEMQAVGVKVHAFHTLWEGLRRFRPLTVLNRRNHRKLLILDDQVGYFGGMNIVENAEPIAAQKTKPISSGWRDVHLRLEGPQQSELAESFDRSWRRAHDEKVRRRPRAYRRAVLPGKEESIRFFDSGWGFKYSRAARVYTALIRRARYSILISMAYFIPVGKVLRALLRARRRRVRMRIVLPGKSDVPLVQRATSYLYGKLLKRGFRLYERQQRMLHSKVIVVDGIWTVVGSCNLDPRSLWINLEFLAVIRSPALAQVMTEIVRHEMAASRRVRLKDFAPSWTTRLINALCWSLRWWL